MRPHPVRGPALVLAVVFITTMSLLVTVTPVHAAATVDRLAGPDRYATGAAVSVDAFGDPSAVTTAYLATGENFADALAAGTAAFINTGPVILTTPNVLDAEARTELRRLQPDRVVVVGGPVAVSAEVMEAVRDDATIGARDVVRIGGDTRYDTAANVVTDAFPERVDTVFVATGQAFPDALAGVPAAARYGAPLLLTQRDTVPAPTRAVLDRLQPNRIIILGGEVAVSLDVEQTLRSLADKVDRLHGGDRYATAVAVSQDAFVGARTVYMATGGNFPDALAGGPAAGMNAGPLLLTQTDALPEAVASELVRLNPHRVVILGGVGAITEAVEQDIRGVLSGVTVDPTLIRHTLRVGELHDDIASQYAPTAADAVVIASQSTGTYTTTGTVTVSSDGHVTYASQPTDRMVVMYEGGPTWTFVIRSMQCQCERGDELSTNAHDIDFDVQVDDALDATYHSVQTSSGDRQGATTGTAVHDGITYVYDLKMVGAWSNPHGVYRTDDRYSGTITSDRMQLTAEFRITFGAASSDDGAMVEIDRYDASSMTIDDVAYRYVDLHLAREYLNNQATRLDDPGAWSASGSLLRDDQPWGEATLRDGGSDVVAVLVTPDGEFEVARWPK